MKPRNSWLSPVLGVLAVVPLLYVAAPLLHLFLVVRPGDLATQFHNPDLGQAILTSASAALVTTALAVVFGLPIAFFLSLWRFRAKRLIEALFVLPLVLPPIVGGMAELNLYGPYTTIGQWLGQYHITLTGSFAGVVLAQTYITSPFLVLAAKAGFDDVPQELREVTRLQGGGLWHVFWHVSVPVARQSIIAGIVLTFARAIGEFGATMMMAYHPTTLPVYLWVDFTSSGLSGIVPVAVLVTLFAIVAAIVGSLLERKA